MSEYLLQEAASGVVRLFLEIDDANEEIHSPDFRPISYCLRTINIMCGRVIRSKPALLLRPVTVAEKFLTSVEHCTPVWSHIYVCMYVWSSHIIAEYGSTGLGCQSCSWSAQQGKLIFPCPRMRLKVWSRETGSAVPSRVSLLILHTQAELGAYSRSFSRFLRWRPFISLNRHTPSGQSRVNRVTQLRTDGVHCRESAGTAPPVVLKVVSVTGVTIFQVTMDQSMCVSLFHTYYWYEVGMLKV